MKVKLLSRVQTPSNPMDCSLPGSSVHGICQARVLEWVATAYHTVVLFLILGGNLHPVFHVRFPPTVNKDSTHPPQHLLLIFSDFENGYPNIVVLISSSNESEK